MTAAPLSMAGSALLDRIARTHSLLAFDFDGTLAPVVGDAADAEMRGETRALLRVAALLYPCAIVSGRARSDLIERVQGVPLLAAIGCHGAEPGFGPLAPELVRRVADWKPRLEKALSNSPGIHLEDKRLCIALHYRNARSLVAAEQDALAAARRLTDATVWVGRAAVHVVPVGAPSKAEAIATVSTRLGIRSAVYIGEDRPKANSSLGLEAVSIRVGAESDASVEYGLANQRQIDDFLRALIAARRRQDGRGDGIQGLLRAVGG